MKIVRRKSLFARQQAMREAAARGVSKPGEGPPVVHINPFANGIRWDGRQHGGPPWRGVCIAGLWVGTHFFRGLAITGIFGRVGNRPGLLREPCKNQVMYRCRFMRGGHVLPFWWLSCGLPDHMNAAGVIEHLDAQGYVTDTEYVTMGGELDAPAEVLALPPSSPLILPGAAPPPRALPPSGSRGGSRRGWNGGKGRPT